MAPTTHHLPHLPDVQAPRPRSVAKLLLKALPVAVVIGSVTAASAATLGLSPKGLGSATAAVSSCDDTLQVAYITSYNATAGDYQVDQVVVSAIDDVACAGSAVDVVVASPSYTELSHGTGTVDSTPATVTTVTVTLAAPVLAEDIGNVSVIISG